MADTFLIGDTHCQTSNLTHTRLKELLHYDENTGVFIWLECRSLDKVGNIAGTTNKRGYRKIKVLSRAYSSHRLAWFYVYGSWPKNTIDHIDGDKANNAIKNLRDVRHFENLQNVKLVRSTNESGFLGVSTHGDKFRARMCVNSKNKHLGLFDTPEEAHQAYVEAKRIHHPFNTL